MYPFDLQVGKGWQAAFDASKQLPSQAGEANKHGARRGKQAWGTPR